MFKNQAAKDNLKAKVSQRIFQTENDIKNWDTIKNMLTIYLTEIAITEFRNSKNIKYITALKMFAGDEIENSKR